MAKIACIYKIKNIITGDFYIGGTSDYANRKRGHRHDLAYNKHSNKLLQAAYNESGKDVFVYELVEIAQGEHLLSLEQHYIDSLKPKYNICKVAGSSKGIKRGEEFCNSHKWLKNKLGKKLSEEKRIIQSNRMKSLITDKEIERLRSINIGKKHRLGKKSSIESIKKISGENSVSHKVSDLQVKEIREKYTPRKYSSYMLAKEYGISRQQINRIVNYTDRKTS
jgi:group I intron endonuclease